MKGHNMIEDKRGFKNVIVLERPDEDPGQREQGSRIELVPDLFDRYPFLKSIIIRANRAAREGRSRLTIVKIIKILMEIELIELNDRN